MSTERTLGDTAGLAASTATRSGTARRIKRLVDIVLAALGLLALAPLLALLAAAVRLTSPGPPVQRRVLGRGGREFEALKLRTMIADADSFWERHPDLYREFRRSFKLPNDPRVTPLGRWLRKTSLDELPQLLNVVRGEMSLVGPRIITRAELEKYGEHADLLLSVRPGLTGLWQVSGRQDVDYTRRVQLDVEYIQTWSLWLDLHILLRTIPAVLRARGAH